MVFNNLYFFIFIIIRLVYYIFIKNIKYTTKWTFSIEDEFIKIIKNTELSESCMIIAGTF